MFAVNVHHLHFTMLTTTFMMCGEISFSFFESHETHKYTLGTIREV